MRKRLLTAFAAGAALTCLLTTNAQAAITTNWAPKRYNTCTGFNWYTTPKYQHNTSNGQDHVVGGQFDVASGYNIKRVQINVGQYNGSSSPATGWHTVADILGLNTSSVYVGASGNDWYGTVAMAAIVYDVAGHSCKQTAYSVGS